MGTSKNWEVLFFELVSRLCSRQVEKIKFPLLLDSSAFGGLARRVKKEVFRGALISFLAFLARLAFLAVFMQSLPALHEEPRLRW